jgi:hypothetical protein
MNLNDSATPKLNLDHKLRAASHRFRDNHNLSDEARDRIRGALTSFAQENPVAGNVEPRDLLYPGTASVWYSREIFLSRVVFVRPILAVLALAIFATSTISYAAEGAVPGDPLYWVKTDVNEELGDALALSRRAQVAWDARKVERRLAEATRLAAEGRLDAEAQAEIEARVDETMTEFARSVGSVRAEDPEVAHSASADFEAALRAHQSVLARFQVREEEKAGVETDAVVAVARRAQVAADNVATVRVQMEAESKERPSYFETAAVAKAEAAKRKVAQAREALAEVHAEVDADSSLEAEASAALALAAEAYADGDAAARRGDHQSAFASYQSAHELATEARLIVSAGPVAIGLGRESKSNREDDEKKSDAREDEPADSDEDEGEKEDRGRGNDAEVEAEADAEVKVNKGMKINVGGAGVAEAATGLF